MPATFRVDAIERNPAVQIMECEENRQELIAQEFVSLDADSRDIDINHIDDDEGVYEPGYWDEDEEPLSDDNKRGEDLYH